MHLESMSRSGFLDISHYKVNRVSNSEWSDGSDVKGVEGGCERINGGLLVGIATYLLSDNYACFDGDLSESRQRIWR